MPIPVWPLTQRPRLDLRVGVQDARVRTQVDHGPPMMRRRYTARMKSWPFTILVTGAEKLILETFYFTTLAEGTLPFDWRDENGTAATFRWALPPGFKPTKPHNVPALRRWEVAVDLEILA